MNDEAKLRERIRQIRALVHAARQRIAALRPVWGAYLAGETLNSLEHAVSELEKEIGLAEPENGSGSARMPGTG